jgi:hypothetical protein
MPFIDGIFYRNVASKVKNIFRKLRPAQQIYVTNRKNHARNNSQEAKFVFCCDYFIYCLSVYYQEKNPLFLSIGKKILLLSVL